MISTSDLKKGVIIDYEGAPCAVETVKVSVPTARGGNSVTRCRLRNLRTKQKVDVSFRGGENFPEVDFEKRPVQLLYTEKGTYNFMDQENYEQFGIHEDELVWERNFLKDEMEGILASAATMSFLASSYPPRWR
jgi:elongation factor P